MRADGWTGTERILGAFRKFSLPTHQKERLVSVNVKSCTTDNNNPQAKAAPYRRINKPAATIPALNIHPCSKRLFRTMYIENESLTPIVICHVLYDENFKFSARILQSTNGFMQGVISSPLTCLTYSRQ